MRAAALVLLLAVPLRAAKSSLAGSWHKDGRPFAELRADGTGTVDGTPVRWKDDGRAITLIDGNGESERDVYTLKGGVMTATKPDGSVVVMTRPGKAAKTARAAPAGGDSLSKLLASSAWCYFHYNQVSGASHQERVVFRADGTWASSARGESYSSGAYGSVAGQSDGGSGGRWRAKAGRLLMAEGGAALADAGLEVSRNSNGYPILKSDGKEYSSCR